MTEMPHICPYKKKGENFNVGINIVPKTDIKINASQVKTMGQEKTILSYSRYSLGRGTWTLDTFRNEGSNFYEA